jgi:hypothetical protein
VADLAVIARALPAEEAIPFEDAVDLIARKSGVKAWDNAGREACKAHVGEMARLGLVEWVDSKVRRLPGARPEKPAPATRFESAMPEDGKASNPAYGSFAAEVRHLIDARLAELGLLTDTSGGHGAATKEDK